MLAIQLQGQGNEPLMYPGPPSVTARLSLTLPRFVLDFGPVDHFSFSTGIWIWPDFWQEDSNGDQEFQSTPTLVTRIGFEPRYFINLKPRMERGKRTDYYSGWYVGMPFRIRFPELKYSIGTMLGFQCSFGHHWYWNVGLGPGCSYDDFRFHMDVMVNAEFGIILN
jgi:hypothetical protein